MSSIIIFHGLTGSSEEVEDIATFLRRGNKAVITHELSGHDKTIDELKKTPAAIWLGDAERFLTEAQSHGQPIIVIGLSFGALLALYLAASHPEKVSAIVTLSCPLKLNKTSDEILLSILSVLPEVILDHLGVVSKKKRKVVRLKKEPRGFAQHSIGASARMFKIRSKVNSMLKSIHQPLLILQDPLDHHVSAIASDLLCERVGSADIRIMRLPYGEHKLPLGPRGDRVCRLIKDFIHSVDN